MIQNENIFSGKAEETPGKLPPKSIFVDNNGRVSVYNKEGNIIASDNATTTSLIEFEYSLDDTDNLMKLNNRPYFHNFTPEIGTGEPWFRNLFLGEDAGNFALTAGGSGGGRYAISCVGIGAYSLNQLTTGNENVGVGTEALGLVSTGAKNTALGSAALYSTTGSFNTGLGRQTGVWMSSGSNNTFVGKSAGHVATDQAQLNTANNCVLLGSDTKAMNGATNAIAIGYTAAATKDNQVVLGHSTITETVLRGTLNADDLQTFADDSAASSLNTGDIYKTATGELRVKL